MVSRTRLIEHIKGFDEKYHFYGMVWIEHIVEDLINSMIFNNLSTNVLTSELTKVQTNAVILEDFETNDGNDTMAKLNSIVDYIIKPVRMIFQIAGNILSIQEQLK